MDEGFVNILLKLVTEQGKEALKDPKKCKKFLNDYTKNGYEDESRLLLLALDAGVGTTIDAASALDFDLKKQAQVRNLRKKYFFDETIAIDVVDTLGFVLRGDRSKTKPQGDAANAEGQTGASSPMPMFTENDWSSLVAIRNAFEPYFPMQNPTGNRVHSKTNNHVAFIIRKNRGVLKFNWETDAYESFSRVNNNFDAIRRICPSADNIPGNSPNKTRLWITIDQTRPLEDIFRIIKETRSLVGF